MQALATPFAAQGGFTVDEAVLAARHYLYTTFQVLLGSDPGLGSLERIDLRLLEETYAILELDPPSFVLKGIEDAQRSEELLEEMSREYTRTLVGPGKLPSSPWESVHVTGDDTLFTLVTLDVRNAYRAQGFLPQDYPRVADDHVALECAFLAALARQALELAAQDSEDACARVLGASQAFLEEHLLKWVDTYATQLAESSSSFYAAVAAALAAFAHADEERLRAER